jgi:hypothetical protein
MSLPSFSLRTIIPRRAQRSLEWALRALSLYMVPLGIVLLSLVALFSWDSHYTVHGDKVLQLRVLPETGAPLSPAQAIAALRDKPALAFSDTKLSEKPRWFSFNTLPANGDVPVVEFPSRHSIDLACWDAVTLSPLGQSTRSRSEGAMSPVKSGFALALDNTPSQIVCRGSFVGPARVTVLQWPADQLSR